MPDIKTRDEAIAKLAELIKDVRIAMLTTVAEDGSLHSRPMAAQQSEFDGDLWFFTEEDALKVHEIEAEFHVNVAFADPASQTYVSVSGRAWLAHSRAKIEELWNPTIQRWFPKGLDDPRLALLKVEVDSAEYWDASSSTVAHIAGFIKAIGS
jgi:general stress protein 26